MVDSESYCPLLDLLAIHGRLQFDCADSSTRRELDSRFGAIEPHSSLSISASSLTMITKKRYRSKWIDTKYLRSTACASFENIHAVRSFRVGIMRAALLMEGAINTSVAWYLFMIHYIFLLMWAAASFCVCLVQDRIIRGRRLIMDVPVGAFAGFLPAAPALFLLMAAEQRAQTSGGLSDAQVKASIVAKLPLMQVGDAVAEIRGHYPSGGVLLLLRLETKIELQRYSCGPDAKMSHYIDESSEVR